MKKALKILLYGIGGILTLVILVVIFLLTPPGKNLIRKQAVSFLSKKLKTEVRIGGLDYRLPKMIELKDVFFGDVQKDTLLSAGVLRVDIAMLKLISGTVQVNEVNFENGVAHIYRNAPDTTFNFDFIIKAFASPNPKKDTDKIEDTSGGMEIDIRKLALKNINFKFDDYTGGSRFGVVIGELEANIRKTDLNHMNFELKNLRVRKLHATMITDTSYLVEKVEEVDTASALPGLAADELDLQDIKFSMQNNLDPMLFEIALAKLLAHPKEIDLNRQYVAISDIQLDTTNIKVVMGKKKSVEEVVEEVADTLASKKWKVLVNTLKLNNINLTMDDENKPKQASGMDFAHLNVQNLVFDAGQILYTTDTIAGIIKHLAVKEQSGFDLQELKTTFAYYPQGAYLNNLYLQTSNTLLQDKVVIRYPSMDALSKNLQAVEVNLNIAKSYVGLKDALIFVPDLKKQPIFQRFGNDRVNLDANINGYANALNIKLFRMSGLGNTYVDLNGKLNGLPDAKKLSYNLNINRLQSTKQTVSIFMPPSLSKQIDLPNTFNITGKLAGTVQDYNTDLVAVTTDGNAVIRGKILMSPGKEKYDIIIKTDKLNVGKIMRQDSVLGRITANLSAKGQSFDINYMNAMVKGDIVSAQVMGYPYQGIVFDAGLNKKQAKANLVSSDPNLRLKLDGSADLRNKYPAIIAKLVVDSADLQALKLYKDELRVSTTIDADIPEMNVDYPRANVKIDKPTVVMNGTRYFIDSMYLSSQPSADSGNHIVFDADAIQAVITGKTPLSQIGDIVKSHISKHYALGTDSTKNAKPAVTAKPLPTDYNLNMAAVIRDRPLLRVLMPGLKQLDTITINAGITPSNLSLALRAPRLQYNDMFIDSAKVNVSGTDQALTYNASVNKFTNSSLSFWYAGVKGDVKGQTINARVTVADSQRTERFGLGAAYTQNGDQQEIVMQPGLKLNYDDWSVAQPNKIVLGKDGFYVQNFKIDKGTESISINSEAPQFSAPITAAINNFLVSNITEIISKDTTLADGVLNMKMTAKDLKTNPQANGTLSITNLSFRRDTIGNLNVALEEASANSIKSRITIDGKGNDIAVSGYYYPKAFNGNNFDLQLDMNALNVKNFEGMSGNQIRNTSGFVRGNLKIQGTIAAPKVSGELRTDQLRTTVAMLGNQFYMPEERIAFTSEGIEFKNFKLVDSTGNEGVISGKILTKDFKDMKLALKVNADKWQVINSTAKDNDLFYGKLLISSNLRINGTPTAPDINGNLTIHDTTKFTVVMPDKQAGIQERDGIVEFIDMSDPGKLKLKDTAVQMMALNKGTKMNLNIGIEKNAEFSVIIDEGTGDFLRVRGQANLNTTMNPDGSIGLTGTYELKDGAYELNYNLIKRKFRIQSGSTITFAGDPLHAVANITAIYDANIPPYDLVQKQVTDPAQLNFYKQRLPFQVLLKMQGELMKPAISFDVQLPEKGLLVSQDVSSLVQAKLSQVRNNESELNKQVFAVLILGRFVADNPFESGAGGGGAEAIARQSVSRFIGEQLNKFADQLVQGLELTFDLESTEDYTTGQKRNKTDLNVAASKRLLNDRLTLTVGNNFELEGQNQNKNQNTSLIPGNLAADYQLTKNGRYMVRVYRKNEVEDILEGFVVETGTSFIVTVDYNRFKNLFINRKKMRMMNGKARLNDKEYEKQQTKGTSN